VLLHTELADYTDLRSVSAAYDKQAGAAAAAAADAAATSAAISYPWLNSVLCRRSSNRRRRTVSELKARQAVSRRRDEHAETSRC